MNKFRRLELMRTLLNQAGARGLTRSQILSYMEQRDATIDDRTFYRYIKELQADGCVHVDDDPGADSEGARRVYFSDKLSVSTTQAIRFGRSLEAFESSAGRIFGAAINDGSVSLHHHSSSSLSDVVSQMRAAGRMSRCFYIGSLRHIHFWLEVPNLLDHDLEVRVGRLESAQQRPTNTLGREQLWVGLPGPALLSRLFGPKAGHVRLLFPCGEREVRVDDLSGGRAGPMTQQAISEQHTPIVHPQRQLAACVVRTPTELTFAGMRALIWV